MRVYVLKTGRKAVPIHKKEQKKIIKNYRPTSLFPIIGKAFERLVFSTLFNSFLQNKLFTTISLA